MLQFKIDGYDGFKEIFGTKNSSRGCISNKILLSFWKHRFKVDGDARASSIRNLVDLYNTVTSQLNNHVTTEPYMLKSRWQESLDNDGGYRRIEECRKYTPQTNFIMTLEGKEYRFFTKIFQSGTKTPYNVAHPGMIKVYNLTSKKDEYIKAGRFINQVMIDNQVNLDQATMGYICEEFQRKIDAATQFDESRYEVHVDKHFDWIYSSKKCCEMHSCMTDKGNTSFYTDCVDANAAYLIDKEANQIVARCIIYNKVYTQDGKAHRYADRVYYADESMGHYLIGYLIREGIIDLHKKVGAGCHDVTMIMDNLDNVIPQKGVAIQMRIPEGHRTSYADTFRYYDAQHCVAVNESYFNFTWGRGNYTSNIDTTSTTYTGPKPGLTSNEITERDLRDFIA